MSASVRSVRLLAAFLSGVTVLMAGCSAGSPPTRPAITGKAAAAPSGVATSSSPATPARPASCNSRVLSVLLLGRTRSAADAAYYQIEFQNISDASCTLYGFPGVSFTSQNYSTQVGAVATRNHRSPQHLITLPPEGSAIALVRVVNAGRYSGGCGQTAVSGILVHPPGLANSVRLPFSGTTCVNRRYHVLSVNAVVQGPAPIGD